MKKYENLIEMAFCYIESGCNENHLQNLKWAVQALKDFRAAGEPIFVLRGHDRIAPQAIRAWGTFVSSEKGLQSEYEDAVAKQDRMVAWQEAHPELVKMPD
jgi:hypothetical protein